MPWIVERIRSPKTGSAHRSTTKISKIGRRHSSTAFRRDYLRVPNTTCRADSSVDGLITHPVAVVSCDGPNNGEFRHLPTIQGISSSVKPSLKDTRTRLNFQSHQRDVNDINGWYHFDVKNTSEVHEENHQVIEPQIYPERESLSSSWTTKKGPKRAVSWMSPIKTVSSFDSSSCPVTLCSNKSETSLKAIIRKNVTKNISENVQLLCDLADAEAVNTTTILIPGSDVAPQTLETQATADENLLSPIGVMDHINTNGIWRRDPGKPVALNIGAEDEAAPADDDDELMCITFTPSDDAEDFFRCDSPVAADPEDIETGLSQNGQSFASQCCPTKPSKVTPDPKLTQQKHRAIFSQLLTFVLALACLSGHASRVLSRYDVPERIVSLVRADTDFEMRTVLRRKYNESSPDVFRSPGKFLDTRQNMVGVWLK